MNSKKKQSYLQSRGSERPVSPINAEEPQPQRGKKPTNLTYLIEKKLANLYTLKKNKLIQHVLRNSYGRHKSIKYKQSYNFQESWETSRIQTNFQQKYSLLKTDNYLYITLHFILYVLYAFTAWFYSVYRIFMLNSNFFIFIGIVMLAKISDAIIKQILLSQTFAHNNDAKRELSIKDYFKFHWLSILSFLYLILISIEDHTLGDNKNQYLIAADLFFAWSCYQRFIEIYSAIKFKSLTSNFKNQIQILQLFGGCILLVHIFGIILYLVSKTNSRINWTMTVFNFEDDWVIKYVYSVYFACTTALTVGYGDITPKNIFQIITIMCVQILGIINIGYIVNEIGRVLSKINEKEEILSNNISQTEKIIKKYTLPQSLATKMRSNFINNRIASKQLHIQQQDNLLSKFKDQLRQKIMTYNHKKAIKYSVFFICNWTKKFQNQIAKKLVRSIYSPQETIIQVFGKEKLFLITKGKLEIEACSSSSQNQITKALNVIEFNPSKEIQFNVYGYSSCISGLKIKIKAVAKDYSICYHLTKQDILRIISESQKDFQCFHEIKDRVQQSPIKQVWQAPNIADSRQHFLPNIYYVIKKDRKTQKKKNNRKSFLRKTFKSRCYVQQQIQCSQNEIHSEKDAKTLKTLEQSSINQTIQPLRNTVLSEKQRIQKYNSMRKNETAKGMVTNRKYKSKYPKRKHLNTEQNESNQLTQILNGFQSCYHFKVYLPRFNLMSVLKKYNKKYCLRQDSASNRSESKLAEVLNDDLIQKLIKAKAYNSQLI